MNWEEILKTAPPVTAGILAFFYFLYQFSKYWTDSITIPKTQMFIDERRAEIQIKIEQAKTVAETLAIVSRETPRQTDIMRTMESALVKGADAQVEIRGLLKHQTENQTQMIELQKSVMKNQEKLSDTVHHVVLHGGANAKGKDADLPKLGEAKD